MKFLISQKEKLFIISKKDKKLNSIKSIFLSLIVLISFTGCTNNNFSFLQFEKTTTPQVLVKRSLSTDFLEWNSVFVSSTNELYYTKNQKTGSVIKKFTVSDGGFINESTIGFSQRQQFNRVKNDFLKQYPLLRIPNLQINYVNTLNSIKSKDSIAIQKLFFTKLKEKLKEIDESKLTDNQKVDYNILSYETELNLERIELEKQWNYNSRLDDSKSIFTVQDGKQWYAYLLKRWVDKEVSTEELYKFGLAEIEKVKLHMKRLQEASGLSKSNFKTYLSNDEFFFKNPDDVKTAFVNIKKKVAVKVDKMFPYINDISDVRIERGTNTSLSQVPAYYNNSTFYFNFFEESFNKRQLGWFYIHEAIPGHHYQFMVNNIVKRTEIQNLFWYPGFAEGWGAYVEYLGNELGVYETIYDEYGKWEWDLIRSVRVALDIAINYYGWSDQKALEFWKQHIKDQDDIGIREINRMKRWPAQVITYKYGASLFLEFLEKAKRDKNFNFKKFHKEIIKNGDIPLSILKTLTYKIN
ncbi:MULTISPECIES: DUF885 domain-containing protein [unclassified Tenacibaculum]|uniref:DUF885 domain-containing protein n=1 Tax=unclassified Tenacibaculum TaxID=2635139 RepID=UPI001F346F85|nr:MULTISPECIES: DUF885 domain-containing protein [unclassified Tenacibaculum]MCF2875248.1 DUF885 domain-containing protein [Tenacibaculum sp. Cn5-1]MCF2935324.1 DUF885 domain-containing protein [Tenacibaculum sp. Cn5-34]MCG7511234.1 DUF885 domain-containing protein [Tenacibaculum sp. Cn5-46]